ncbi:hypothetical protein LVD15_16505 [Fulvivirga maritima]|uniref:hypothetical protein n=1 Tax=Fulvivirga maritima TaxID=2904247 RepID=UPI001F20314C|nr:hypothetical protein [Fulvivirga maritima]UII24901.1 hypothetical protein LVD15_16505 [Fulvivirga maritima]
MTKKLKHSIENLYKDFEKYKATDMTGNPLYEDLSEWNQDLLSKPLRELNEDNLSRFTGKVLTSWGSVNDYKHFLPRIFELTAYLRTPYEVWIVLQKLILAEFQNWADEEKNGIYGFMVALWECIVNH